jgi:hypothetical protein
MARTEIVGHVMRRIAQLSFDEALAFPDAPPGAIVASTTVLSAVTGLSFDAPFAMRGQ